VLRANRLTFSPSASGRGSAEILVSEIIDPEVPFLIGKDTNDMREHHPRARAAATTRWA
jgi:twitching motility protein PilJ